jgi:hypothetical protein
MAEFMKGCKVIIRGEIAEISGSTAIIKSGDGLVAADLSQLEHDGPWAATGNCATCGKPVPGGSHTEDCTGLSPAGIPGIVTAAMDLGTDEDSAALTETQLSFVVTKHWARPEGEAGWTEMTCSKGSFRRVLEWMLEELPPEMVVVQRSVGNRTLVISIDWASLPEGIRAPVIPPYLPPDPAEAERARLLEIVGSWPVHETAQQLASAVYGLLSQPEVPERPEP